MIIFLNTLSARKQQHKLFIDVKIWSQSLDRGTIRNSRGHKLKQYTNLILQNENYTSFAASLLIHKIGRGEGALILNFGR